MIRSPQDYEKDFKKKYSRWSPLVWQQVVENCVPKILQKTQLEDAQSEKLLKAYIELCGEAIGSGRLFPNSESLYSLFMLKLIPELIALEGSAEVQVRTLVDVWNFCEAADQEAAWVQKIFYRVLGALPRLSELEKKVDSFNLLLKDSSEELLGTRKVKDLSLAIYSTKELGYFLPKKLNFVAPPVLEISGTTPNGSLTLSVYLPDAQRLLSVEKRSELNLRPAAMIDAQLLGNFLRALPFQLSVQDFAINNLGAAVIFEESQNIWVWSRR